MFFQKQQVGDHDIALRHGLFGGLQGLGVLAPFGGGKNLHLQARIIRNQSRHYALTRPRGMGIERHDHHAVRG